MKIKIMTIFIVVCLITSCKSVDQVAYFQDIDKYSTQLQQSGNIDNYQARIVPDDLLSITVSSVDPNSVAVFNLPLTSYMTPGESVVNATMALQSYLVDADGFIVFPVIGKIKASGLTRSELSALLKDKISAYAKSPLVTVKILNFKIAVLGEVTKPGTVVVPNERVSILDALGLAGDLTIHGERTNVLLIRVNDGKKEFHRFDLTSSELFDSPYYYLQQNDVVYVEPNKARKGNSKYSQNSQFNVSVASTLISALSVLTSLAIALLIK